MKRATVIAALRSRRGELRRRGATSLYLFGSTVRNAAKRGSDVDVFIEYNPRRRFSLFDLVGIKQYLEDELRTSVDVTTRDGLHPMLRERIEKSAMRVF